MAQGYDETASATTYPLRNEPEEPESNRGVDRAMQRTEKQLKRLDGAAHALEERLSTALQPQDDETKPESLTEVARPISDLANRMMDNERRVSLVAHRLEKLVTYLDL